MATWTGLWDNVHGQAYAQIGGLTHTRYEIARQFKQRGGLFTAAQALALNGATVGTNNVVLNVNQVEALQNVGGYNLGGKRNVVTRNIVNRPSTATDKTTMDSIYAPSFIPPAYPSDRGGGGGGKLGTL